MAAKIFSLRPKRHDTITQTLQLALDLPLDLSQSTRDELADALGRFAPTEQWTYAMLNPDQLRAVLKLINASPKPATTLRIWTAAISHVHRDTGEIMAGRSRLATDAETSEPEASRALSRLAQIGALLRHRPGRYAINPRVGWNGSLAKRDSAAKEAPPLLRLVETP